MNRLSLAVLALAATAGCTAIDVQQPSRAIDQVCVLENPRVIREDFLPAVMSGFKRNGVEAISYAGTLPLHCRTTATYKAEQTWDIAMVLSSAELHLYRDGIHIGSAVYRQKGPGGGGMSFLKWRGSEAKFGPAMDKMLGDMK